MLIITRKDKRKIRGGNISTTNTQHTLQKKKIHKKSIDNLNKIYKGEFEPSSLNENM